MPDLEVRGDVWKENTVLPFQNFHAISVSIPIPVWDRNQGNILAASSALVRAAEGPHQVEVALTTGLASAYGNYKANLAAVEYYRGNILPDQVRYYRGVFERRKIDPGVAFGDLVQAQQVLVADVTAYLSVLGSLWTSVVTVANYLQTDDLFQLGRPLELPQLPDFNALHPFLCPHPQLIGQPAVVQPIPARVPHAATTVRPAPTMLSSLGQWINQPRAAWANDLFTHFSRLDPAAGDAERGQPILGQINAVPSVEVVPPVATPFESLAPDLSQRSRAASSRSSS